MISSKTIFCSDFELQSKSHRHPEPQKSMKNKKKQGFSHIEQTAPRCFQDALGSLQRPFRLLQDTSKIPPDASKNPPRTSKTPPRHPQELSKSAPRCLQGRSKRPPGAQEAARAAQEAPRRLQEPPRVSQEASRSTPRSLQERAKRPLKPNPKMPQRPQELRCCKERFISKVQGSSAWVGGTRECGYNPPHTFGVARRVKSKRS